MADDRSLDRETTRRLTDISFLYLNGELDDEELRIVLRWALDLDQPPDRGPSK